MSIKAVCHWGEAEDVCIIVENSAVIVLDEETQIPLTRRQARALAAQLLDKANQCDLLEQGLNDLIDK